MLFYLFNEAEPGREPLFLALRRHEASICVEDIVRWGVWLGRHICETISQVSYGELNENRNLM